jgi:ADP-heptose:LPS heptosyltransferase
MDKDSVEREPEASSQGKVWTGLYLNRDCRHFVDHKPCQPHKKYGVLCDNCSYYDPIKTRILIMKLEALGDVLRTTSVLRPFKEKHPGAHITWVVGPQCLEVLKNNPYIDRVMVMGYETALSLMIEEFDVAINFDKAHEASALLTLTKAREKFGFELDRDGNIRPLNAGAKYFMDIGVSDEHMRRSRETQQEIVFDIVGLKYEQQKSVLVLEDELKAFAEERFKQYGIAEQDLVIGFNTGCSNRIFLDRKWTIEGFVELARLVYDAYGAKVLLLGGPNEIERNREIEKESAVPVINTGNHNSFRQFAALLNKCDLLVSCDTMAVHVAAALGVPVVVFFGNRLPYEIEIYGKGKKLLTDMECRGCYKFKCEFEETCMDRLRAATVFSAVEEVLIQNNISRPNRGPGPNPVPAKVV